MVKNELLKAWTFLIEGYAQPHDDLIPREMFERYQPKPGPCSYCSRPGSLFDDSLGNTYPPGGLGRCGRWLCEDCHRGVYSRYCTNG